MLLMIEMMNFGECDYGRGDGDKSNIMNIIMNIIEYYNDDNNNT